MEAPEQRAELVALARSRSLDYPIGDKREFVAQMSASSGELAFRGQAYDARHVSTLIPDFFFPLESEDDLVEKTMDLLASRGLIGLFRSGA